MGVRGSMWVKAGEIPLGKASAIDCVTVYREERRKVISNVKSQLFLCASSINEYASIDETNFWKTIESFGS